jgi:hypothetical protein
MPDSRRLALACFLACSEPTFRPAKPASPMVVVSIKCSGHLTDEQGETCQILVHDTWVDKK